VASNRGAYTDTFNVNGRAAGAQFGCLRARDRVVYGAALDLMHEYLAFAFENKEFPTPATFGDRGGGVRPEAQVLRAGLNFHF
jgi:hypothetical protein